ncbi:MAG: NAD(P)-binding domain-containing protein [Hyphomicrobiales bacterium]|nr:NAD(P)-binding domain-containing protein [Hyphomicrobiales bacterium]
MPADPIYLAYLGPLALIWLIYIGVSRRSEQRHRRVLNESVEAGLTEPASLHPRIDPSLCLGCGACVQACPEGQVIGLIGGKAALIQPSDCIGHGACKAACPYDAISLVFGTETRGVDIPVLKPNFETNVPGIYIAGELGGMGLVRNAIEQGRQTIESIPKFEGTHDSYVLDVVIVGAGPAGISASLAAMERKLNFVTVEQDSLGGTVAHFPRNKMVMTQTTTLPIYGKVKLGQITKERLLDFWLKVAKDTGLQISYDERVLAITKTSFGFEVQTTRHLLKTGAVLLAIGRRGTPRRLDVPGEEQSKVVYRLVDPEQYRGKKVLVVGGGDSALEAAASIAEQDDTNVTLSYRDKAFSRAKPTNRKRVDAGSAAGRLEIMLNSQVREIGEQSVRLDWDGQPVEIPNDAVIVCAGGILPTNFLQSMGIEVETKYGTA